MPGPLCAQRVDGFNVVVTPGHPFGSSSAERALIAAKRFGATGIAIIPFLWQPTPSSPHISRGGDMSDEELRLAIRQARRLGLTTIVKPHIWVPTSWAGAVDPGSDQDTSLWFADYASELDHIARISAAEGADILALGTELSKLTQRAGWRNLISTMRAAFAGKLIYIAHNVEEAEAVPFWHLLDAIGVSLYPPLGADDDRDGRRAVMRAVAARLDALSKRIGKTVVVGEIGLRSARGAAGKPWESAEERNAPVDLQLQADVLEDWLAALDGPAISGVLIWRRFTDPDAGGAADTDFTVQGKPAEEMLRCVWAAECR